jgi:SAM-dependent methyltransferase
MLATRIRRRLAHLWPRPPAAPAADRRVWLAREFLRGSGLEIGALHNPLWLPPGVTVRYVDRLPVAELRRHYPELGHLPLVDVHVVDDGETLATVGPASQDFIIANHFLEHTQDPIGTIRRHLDVLRPGGILYLAVPDKRWTFDVRRPVTPLAHLYRDHEDGPAASYLGHVREWAALVDGLGGEALEERVRRLVEMNYSIHFHVWTERELLELLVNLRERLRLPFDVRAMLRNGIENIYVLERTADGD